jgi:hypothetical protein
MSTRLYVLKTAVFALPIMFAATTCQAQAYGYLGGASYDYPCIGFASTPAEGYGRGVGDIIRSKGVYNLLTSQAAINATEAVKNDIQNRELWVDAYFQMRRDNRIARAEERGPHPTAEELIRYAQSGKPKPLGPNQFDAVSGKIYWPRSLRTDEFADSRAQLDELLAKRAHYGDMSMEDFMKVKNLTDRMMGQLKQQVRDMPSMEYVAAKSFLVSLAYEVQNT